MKYPRVQHAHYIIAAATCGLALATECPSPTNIVSNRTQHGIAAPPLIVCDHKIARAKMYIFRELRLTALCRMLTILIPIIIFLKSLVRYIVDNTTISIIFYCFIIFIIHYFIRYKQNYLPQTIDL